MEKDTTPEVNTPELPIWIEWPQSGSQDMVGNIHKGTFQ